MAEASSFEMDFNPLPPVLDLSTAQLFCTGVRSVSHWSTNKNGDRKVGYSTQKNKKLNFDA